MKTSIKNTGVGILFIAFMLVANLVQASDTRFGAFEVLPATEKMEVNGTAVETYVITYSDMQSPVYVGIYKDKKCIHYIVRTEGFEIEYQCKNGKFGAAFVDDAYATMNELAVQKRINQESFKYQKMIYKGEKSDAYKLEVIAGYLPELYKAG